MKNYENEIKKDSIVVNYILQSFYKVLQIVLPLITTPYISRILTSTGVGEFTYVSSVSYFFILAANLGIANYGNRVIAENANNRSSLSRAFWSIYYCHFIVSFMAIAVYIFFVEIFVEQYKWIFYCELFALFAAMFEITWFFTGLQQFRITVARSTIARLVSVVLVFIFVKERTDVWKYIVILSGGQLLSQLVTWLQVKRYISFSKPCMKDIFSHVRPMIVLFIPQLAVGLYHNMGKVLLTKFSDASQTGLYGSADRIINIPLGLITALGVVSLPKISELLLNGREQEAISHIRVSMRFALWLACGMIFGLIGIAPVFVPVFLGEGYEGCIMLISMMAITILFVTWSDVLRSHFLIPKKRDRAYVLSVLLGAVINLIIDIMLIPSFQAVGAVIGAVVAEVFVAIVQSFYAKELPFADMIKPCISYFLSGICMCVCVRVIGNYMNISIITLGVEILFGVLFYLLLTLSYLKKKNDPLWDFLCNKFDRIRKR